MPTVMKMRSTAWRAWSSRFQLWYARAAAVGDAEARRRAGDDLVDARFLSDYREPPIPPGRKSIAFAVTFQSRERTLTDEDAAALRGRIVTALEEAFGAQLRA